MEKKTIFFTQARSHPKLFYAKKCVNFDKNLLAFNSVTCIAPVGQKNLPLLQQQELRAVSYLEYLWDYFKELGMEADPVG